MPKTDRQTDKATWWCITAYNDEIAILEDKTKFPDWVNAVYGGREECPTTKRLHFQGALQCFRQVRFSAVKSWLPTAHIEVAHAKECLLKYVFKSETAVGKKLMVENPNQFLPFHEMCMLVSQQEDDSSRLLDSEACYWDAVNKIILTKPHLSASLSNPSLRNFWIRTRHTWRAIKGQLVLPAPTDTNELLIPGENACSVCNELFKNCECSD